MGSCVFHFRLGQRPRWDSNPRRQSLRICNPPHLSTLAHGRSKINTRQAGSPSPADGPKLYAIPTSQATKDTSFQHRKTHPRSWFGAIDDKSINPRCFWRLDRKHDEQYDMFSTQRNSLARILTAALAGCAFTSGVLAQADTHVLQSAENSTKLETPLQPITRELPKLLPEGTFLPARLGRVITIATGERLIVFSRDASGTAPRPMILLPSPGLDSIVETLGKQDSVAGDTGDMRSSSQEHLFVCSGRVYVYHNWNFLLPLTVREATRNDTGGSSTPDPAALDTTTSVPGTTTQSSDDLDPTIDSLIKELEHAQRGPRAFAADPSNLGIGTASNASVESEVQNTHTKDRSVLRRTGRIGRVGGAWTFLLDNNATSSDNQQPLTQPISILPCQALESIEKLVGQYGTSVRLEVTGLIVHTRHRPMLLPSFFQLVESNELRPLQ